MNWAQLVIPLSTIAALILLSIVARLSLPSNARVPMQWGVGGTPTWFASPGVAVGFVPTFACVVFAVILAPVVFANSGVSRAVPTEILSVIAVVFLVTHSLHLWFAVRHVRRHSN